MPKLNSYNLNITTKKTKKKTSDVLIMFLSLSVNELHLCLTCNMKRHIRHMNACGGFEEKAAKDSTIERMNK